MAAILQRLKQRKLVQWALAYLAAAWVVLQVLGLAADSYDLPHGLMRIAFAVIALGFVVTLVLAWYHGDRGMQRVTGTELLILALLLAIGGGLLWQFGRVPQARGVDAAQLTPGLVVAHSAARAAASAPGTTAAQPLAIPAKSIAVLPLANGGGEGQQFFSDGLSEALIIALSQFDGLKVIGRNSSFQFRDTKDASAVIGRKLGVAHLLEGSVQHAGDAVRISVELIDAASGQTRWSQHYDRPYKDLFKLQDEITNAVAGALHARLLSPDGAAQHSDRPPSGNIEAYSAYLQGVKQWHSEHFKKAAEYMSRAVQIDPGYAMAWAQLSGSRSTVAMFWNEAPALAREHMREARAAVDKALQLAPGLGAAHAALAYLQFYDYDNRGAWTECRRAVQLAPEDAMVLNGCAFNFTGLGKLKEAIRLRERLLSIEPLYAVNNFQYARLLMATGRLDEAAKYLRTDKEVPWSYPLERLKLAVLRGDAGAAREIAKQAPPRDHTFYMTLAAQIGPDRAAADTWLADLLADKAWMEWVEPDGRDDNRYNVAQIYALRGDAGHTLEWLERSLASHPPRARFLLADPFMLRFRDAPWFIALCRKLGLPPPSESEVLGIDQIRAANAARS